MIHFKPVPRTKRFSVGDPVHLCRGGVVPLKTWIVGDSQPDESPAALEGVIVGGGCGNSARYFVVGYPDPVWDWMLDPVPRWPAHYTSPYSGASRQVGNLYDRAVGTPLFQIFTSLRLKLLQPVKK